MANSLKKRALFIDSIGTVSVTAMTPIIMGIMITPSAQDSRVIILESVNGTKVIDVKIENIESRYISFEAFGGLVITKDFEIEELTNIENVILYGFWSQPVNRGVARV